MNGQQYKEFRRANPHLKLPQWESLLHSDREKIDAMNEQELLTRRSVVLLTRDPGVRDRIRFNASRNSDNFSSDTD